MMVAVLVVVATAHTWIALVDGELAKSEPNLRERGFDFAFATLIFESATVEVEDRRKDYGKHRVVAIGVADGLHLTVVYTDRETPKSRVMRRVISARRSSRHERKIYEQAKP